MPSLHTSRTISCRLDDEETEAVERHCARLGISRAQWLKALVLAAIAADDPETDMKPGKHAISPGKCPHPKARVIKGFCYACGEMTSR